MSKQAVIVLAAVALLLVLFMFYPKREKTKEEALKFVEEDIVAKYGTEAKYNISATKEDGNWKLQVDVIIDPVPACPSRKRLYYNYPAFGYIQREETITDKCKICIGLEPGACRIFFEEEAVIASHSRPGGLDVSEYISTYSDARPYAKFYASGYEMNGRAYENVWLVNWNSASANYTMHALVDPNGGKAVGVWTTDKTA